ncbi:GNAT family N-acetyltransferase [Clostridium sp. P21]|uniref:GNAT family N-acetyltransferase n=1 Tax=Clostridium muellerianum TaxID=2716538 RepID=A0A7Y0EH46_9CLOT|nr:GNAT family N-acetyltransferase [Clostridium muellerianum]
MENHLKQSYENYQLILLNEKHIQTIFNWNIHEKNFEYYTCRPLKLIKSFEEYANKTLAAISEGEQIIYVLVSRDDCNKPLGKISLFDLNARNHSAEFGYYLPDNNRGHGLGSIMVSKFIENSFKNDELNLNKIYATTSSNNYFSVKLLEKYGFKLDGRLREHYWIGENRHDQLIYSILKQE